GQPGGLLQHHRDHACSLRDGLSFILVEHLDEVLETALAPEAALELDVEEVVGGNGRSQLVAELLP
ncbi:MAG TPA: hypothetical protein G4N97_07230, partial [Thermoflexia bacterium]|nr:hypothetical protein [Thermoflexia bacterium]